MTSFFWMQPMSKKIKKIDYGLKTHLNCPIWIIQFNFQIWPTLWVICESTEVKNRARIASCIKSHANHARRIRSHANHARRIRSPTNHAKRIRSPTNHAKRISIVVVHVVEFTCDVMELRENASTNNANIVICITIFIFYYVILSFLHLHYMKLQNAD